MTEEQLKAIKERLANATPGPWKYNNQYRYLAPTVPQRNLAVITNEITKGYDAEFIANAPTDIQALIAEVERLNTDNAKLYQALYERDVESVKQEKEIKKLQEALEFYADENNNRHKEAFTIGQTERMSEVAQDEGYLARKALEGEK